MSSAQKMTRIVNALVAYHDKYGAFPKAASVDSDGKPLLSWRVALLPFLDESAIYQQFNLEEPWDGPTNQPLLEKMPKIYRNPSLRRSLGTDVTNYQVFVGDGSIFDPNLKGQPDMLEVGDGTDSTLMLAESPLPVPWTKPDNLPFQPGTPVAPLLLPGATATKSHWRMARSGSFRKPAMTPIGER